MNVTLVEVKAIKGAVTCPKFLMESLVEAVEAQEIELALLCFYIKLVFQQPLSVYLKGRGKDLS